MSRIRDTFVKLKHSERGGFIPFITAGDPDLVTTELLLIELAAAAFQITQRISHRDDLFKRFFDLGANRPVARVEQQHVHIRVYHTDALARELLLIHGQLFALAGFDDYSETIN